MRLTVDTNQVTNALVINQVTLSSRQALEAHIKQLEAMADILWPEPQTTVQAPHSAKVYTETK